jgi:hypothetical protein
MLLSENCKNEESSLITLSTICETSENFRDHLFKIPYESFYNKDELYKLQNIYDYLRILNYLEIFNFLNLKIYTNECLKHMGFNKQYLTED